MAVPNVTKEKGDSREAARQCRRASRMGATQRSKYGRKEEEEEIMKRGKVRAASVEAKRSGKGARQRRRDVKGVLASAALLRVLACPSGGADGWERATRKERKRRQGNGADGR